jgi:GT2 family glycosyltransferase
MGELSIGVLLTNYNTWSLALQCVEACVKQDGSALSELVVYDDGSTKPCDVTFPPPTRVALGGQNVGLVKALNKAFAEMESDIVVLFDSDAYPTTPYVDAVRNAFTEDSTLGLVAFATIGKDGLPTQSWCPEPDALTLVLGLKLSDRIPRLSREYRESVSVYTCAMAIRRSVFEEIGGFDERFDWTDLDHDLSMNVARSNWKVEVMPEVIAFHEGSGTPQGVNARLLRFHKNRWYLLTKHGRIKFKAWTRALVLTRLRLELLGIYLSIRDPELKREKASGRKAVIKFCQETYR